MTEPDLAIVRVASTPTQAKLFVALLEAEGIPAFVEGDGLADEVATSRRLMNLACTQVKVPAAALQRAAEVLDRTAVPDEELEAQALAAEAAETPPRPPHGPLPRLVWIAVGVVAGAVLTWIVRDAADAAPPDPYYDYDYETVGDGVRATWRQDPRHHLDYFDRDGDGFYERIESHGAAGALETWADDDRDGRYERWVVRDAGGTEVQWRQTEGADFFDAAVVLDPTGAVLGRLRWVAGRGFELTPP